jgi:hypothetical protein
MLSLKVPVTPEQLPVFTMQFPNSWVTVNIPGELESCAASVAEER